MDKPLSTYSILLGLRTEVPRISKQRPQKIEKLNVFLLYIYIYILVLRDYKLSTNYILLRVHYFYMKNISPTFLHN